MTAVGAVSMGQWRGMGLRRQKMLKRVVQGVDAVTAKRVRCTWIVRTMGRFQGRCSSVYLGNWGLGTMRKPWGCPPTGLVEGDRR